MRFATIVLRNILRRRTRSVLTVAGVAVAVCAVVALTGVSREFEASLRRSFTQRRVDLMVLRAGSVQKFSSVLDESLGERIARLDGVREVGPGLVDVLSFHELDLLGVPVRGLLPGSGALADLTLREGRAIRPGDGRAVLLGHMLARTLRRGVGQTLELIDGEPFEVVGVFESPEMAENGAMIVPLAELQRLMDRQGKVTYFLVGCARNDRESLEAIARRIEALAPALAALPAGEYVDASIEVRMARAVASVTSTIALLIGAIGMVNTMMTAVFERTREVAVLRAIGWRKSRIVRMVLFESSLLAAAGAAAGSLAAVGLVELLARTPQAAQLAPGRVAPEVVLLGFALALGVGLIGGLYPAWRAAQLLPTEGLRHE